MIKDIVERLEQSKLFLAWHTKHEGSYLVHAFNMESGGSMQDWQVGYYDPKSDSITAFVVGKSIIQNPEAEVFKDKDKVDELDMTVVETRAKEALETADILQKKKYTAYEPIKKIIILQHLDEGQVWNITYITRSFSTLNIKIDAANGQVLKDKVIELFDMQ